MTDNTPTTCPRNEQAIGWALHSLEPDEEIAVLSHLPVCPSCRRAADDAVAVLGHLGAAVEQVEPPPALRNRLMAQVADTPQKPPAAPTRQHSQQASMPPSRDEQRGSTRPADNRPGRASRWSRRTRQLVAGALAMVAVLAIGGLAVRNVQLQQERDAQIAQIQSLENLLDQFDRPDVDHALLARDDGSTIAAVVVENGRQQVFPIGVPVNATDRDIYVLWGIPDGSSTPEPLGTFDVTDATEGPLDVGSAGTDNYAAYAISIEPGRAAPAVPTTVVASGAVAA